MFAFMLIPQLSWVLYADILCLNASGNITDACVLALVGALMNGARFERKSLFTINFK